MTDLDPIGLFFGGMEKLGPGRDADTVQVLRSLPRERFDVVVDAGCGAGRQTLALAKALGCRIDAVDSHQPFLDSLGRRAAQAGAASLIHARCMDMKDIPAVFPDIDLLWSEGAAYNIGFANALVCWRPAVRAGGFVVVSELVWLQDDPPPMARAFFQACYPDMKPMAANIAIAGDAGYRVLGTHTLPREAWVEGYYAVLQPRAAALADHADASVRALAQEIAKEIEVFSACGGSYGYVFYVLERP
ncbi:class I SAM-dependent methyltransferase [Vineibacter terrae]|uniref:Class I SAM-dependent methyltransferase n=2 Tax=Vineibacter terrae TaxID=2586908 RepID=A0A5C8PTD0_9HYPH|nr:class I SAM-dependent methyltransferase [Vineibacter terrae]